MGPAPKGQASKVYIKLEIGDQNEAAKQEKGYELAQNFLKSVGSQYGWPDSLTDLDDEAKEIFEDAFSSDPTWSSQGAARLTPPDALTKGYLEIELDYKAAPKAAENFRCLCTGEKGKGKASGKNLHYKGLAMHRIVKGFVAQGGDIVKNDGSGGDSIYNGAFKDEKTALALKNDAAGVVGMANSGPHTNKSQFYITLGPAPQCDDKHVVFGKVVNSEGLEFLKKIDELAASESGAPRADVLIADCGEVL